MKTLLTIAGVAMLGCAVYADVHRIPMGAPIALLFSIWFVAYCNADKIP